MGTLYHLQWRNRQGAKWPPETSDREISADIAGKKEARKKRENGQEKKENRKREGGKLQMEGWKVEKLQNEERTFFFWFFLLLTFQNHINLFLVYQNGNFYREKAFHAGKKIRKNDFAPSEKFFLLCP